MNRIAFIFLICFSLIGTLALSQAVYYPFYTNDTTNNHLLSLELSNKVKNSFTLPSGVNSKYKKEFLDIQKEHCNYVKDLVRNTTIADSIILPYLKTVLGNIQNANPSLNKYNIILSDVPKNNVAYIGGNTIVFYVPMFSRLENESQLAAILCHEIAHGELNHPQLGLIKRLDAYYSKDFQKELEKTKKEKYNVYKKLTELGLKYTYDYCKHSRAFEKSADSLGYIFLSKTDYNSGDIITMLEILKHSDEPLYKDSIIYSTIFNCNNLKFDFNSIKPYKSTSIFKISAEAKAIEDSILDALKTHPECDLRIEYARELMKSIPPHFDYKSNNREFEKLKWYCAMEMIAGYYKYEQYDQSLYNSLLFLQHYPNNEYLHNMIVLNYYNLYSAMKDHELADLLSNYSEENYKTFNDYLFTINNLRLSELKELIQCFYTSHKASITEDEYGISANYCYANITEDASVEKWRQKYVDKYKMGRFNKLPGLIPDPKKKKKK